MLLPVLPKDYATVVRTETATIAALVASSPDALVPSCPGWTLTNLGEHVALVQRFWLDIVRGERRRREDVVREAKPDATTLPDWIRDGGRQLAEVLAGADPATPLWTWARDKTAGFVQRRQAQEVAVHRFDAEAATGRPSAIDPALAADGLNEFFEIVLTHNDPALTGSGESLAVVPDDAGDPWRATFDPTGVSIERGRSDADCVVSGHASNLLLVLWRRLPEETVAVEGKTGVLIRLMSGLDLD